MFGCFGEEGRGGVEFPWSGESVLEKNIWRMAAVAAPGTIVASARCKAQTPSRGVRSTRVVRGARNVRGINSGRAENRTAIVSRCTGENTVEKGGTKE